MKNTSVINHIFWSVVCAMIFLPAFFARANAAGEGSNTLPNPLGNTSTFPDLIKKILGVVIQIGVPVATLFIIYSGFLFIKAQGNAEKLKEAKETFFWTIVGTAVLLGAWVLAQAIAGTIDSLK